MPAETAAGRGLHGGRRRGVGLRVQPGGEEHFGAVEQGDGGPARTPEVVVGPVVVRQRGRQVPGAGGDEAAVVPDLRLRLPLAEVPVDRLRLAQVGLGLRQRAAVGVQHPAVGQRTRLPGPVAVAAEHGERRVVARQCLLLLAEPVKQQRPLHLRPRRR